MQNLHFNKKYIIRLTIIATLIIVNLILEYTIPKNGFIYVHFNNAGSGVQNFFKLLIVIPLVFGKYALSLISFLSYITAQIMISFDPFSQYQAGGMPLITFPLIGIIIGIVAEVIIHIIRRGYQPKE